MRAVLERGVAQSEGRMVLVAVGVWLRRATCSEIAHLNRLISDSFAEPHFPQHRGL